MCLVDYIRSSTVTLYCIVFSAVECGCNSPVLNSELCHCSKHLKRHFFELCYYNRLSSRYIIRECQRFSSCDFIALSVLKTLHWKKFTKNQSRYQNERKMKQSNFSMLGWLLWLLMPLSRSRQMALAGENGENNFLKSSSSIRPNWVGSPHLFYLRTEGDQFPKRYF